MNEIIFKRLVENYELKIECDEMESQYGGRGLFMGYYPNGETKVAFVPLPKDFDIEDVDDETGEVALSETSRNEILLRLFHPQVLQYKFNMINFKATIYDKLLWTQRLTSIANIK